MLHEEKMSVNSLNSWTPWAELTYTVRRWSEGRTWVNIRPIFFPFYALELFATAWVTPIFHAEDLAACSCSWCSHSLGPRMESENNCGMKNVKLFIWGCSRILISNYEKTVPAMIESPRMGQSAYCQDDPEVLVSGNHHFMSTINMTNVHPEMMYKILCQMRESLVVRGKIIEAAGHTLGWRTIFNSQQCREVWKQIWAKLRRICVFTKGEYMLLFMNSYLVHWLSLVGYSYSPTNEHTILLPL